MIIGSAADFSSVQGRYRTFLGPGLLQAKGFRLVWNAMREEAGRGKISKGEIQEEIQRLRIRTTIA
jgi:hypothetical protein